MGRHVIQIDMTGGHGCDRKAQEGDKLALCSSPSCPDCEFRRLVSRFVASGAFNYGGSATITHWPGDPGEVVDDLVSGTRKKGHF